MRLRRRVVAAGLLALVAGGGGEREARRLAVDLGVELEQRLVDRAELLGAEVAEVDRPAAALDVGEFADRLEQRLVAQARIADVRRGVRDPQGAAEGREREHRLPAVVEPVGEELDLLVQVVGASAATADRQASQALVE